MIMTEELLMAMVEKDAIMRDECLYCFLSMLSESHMFFEENNNGFVLTYNWEVNWTIDGEGFVLTYVCGDSIVRMDWPDYMVRSLINNV